MNPEHPDSPTTDPDPATATTPSGSPESPPAPPELDSWHTVERIARQLERTVYLPRELHSGPITEPYGHDRARQDRVHATHLREIQTLAALHATDPDHGPGPDVVAEARRDALTAGVPAADITTAEQVGADGVAWVEHPAHRLLGRIEQLSTELGRARERAASYARTAQYEIRRGAEANSQIAELTDQLDTAHTAIRALRHDLDARNWETAGERHHEGEPVREWHRNLVRDTTTDPPAADDGPGAGGEPIGAAVDAAIPDTGRFAAWEPAPAGQPGGGVRQPGPEAQL